MRYKCSCNWPQVFSFSIFIVSLLCGFISVLGTISACCSEMILFVLCFSAVVKRGWCCQNSQEQMTLYSCFFYLSSAKPLRIIAYYQYVFKEHIHTKDRWVTNLKIFTVLKGVTSSDEPTDSYHRTVVSFSSMECFITL